MKIRSYGNLIKTLAITDFKLKYEGSVLGYLWSLVKPLLLFSVYYLVFTKVFKIGANIPAYPIYLLTGIVVWSFFQETTITALYSIVNKGDLIRKVYFPRIALVFSNSLTSFLTFFSNLTIVFIFMFFNGVPLTNRIILLPLVLLELFAFVFGIGLLMGALFVKFRDIAHIWEVFLQALFYATPILYSPDLVPLKIRLIQMISPLTQIMQDFRYILISDKTITAAKTLPPELVWIPYFLPIVIFMVGYLTFEKMAAKFAEEV